MLFDMNNQIVKPEELYARKKRRLLGEAISTATARHSHGFAAIHESHKDELITYESEGLVVAISGGGSLEQSHTQCQEARALVGTIVKSGGIIINGGRPGGIMGATTSAAQGKSIGVVFTELKKEIDGTSPVAMVNSPQPRNEILATCAPIIVVFRGGLGTFQVLMRAIVHLKNREYHTEQPPQLLFVSNYWIGLLNTMMNLGTLPKEFVTQLHFFNSAADIINTIPQP